MSANGHLVHPNNGIVLLEDDHPMAYVIRAVAYGGFAILFICMLRYYLSLEEYLPEIAKQDAERDASDHDYHPEHLGRKKVASTASKAAAKNK
jgi:hypothetical protein